VTYREVWRNRQFRVVFGSRSLATLADTLRTVALSVVVYAATDSPALAAVTYGISFLPQLFGASLFGALTDRIRPRRLIACGYLAEGIVGVVLATLPLPVWACLALLATVACVTPVFAGASSRVIADVLTGDAYILGRSMSNLASSVAQLFGLTAAGFAVAAFGDRRAVLVSALAHLVASAWVHLRLADRPEPDHGDLYEMSAVRQSWVGNLALLRDRPVRILLLAQWLPPAMLTGADALVVPYASERGFPAGTAGWLLAGVPVGMIVGNFVFGRLVTPARHERLVPVLVALMGLPCLVFPAGLPWPAIAAALAVVGVGFTFLLGLQRRFRDAIPESGRGQAFSLLATGLMTAQGLLPAMSGLVAEAVPTAFVIALLGGVTVLIALVLPAVLPVAGRTAVRVAG
jgi:predicted MFS family arabinose efflux permease